VHIETILHDVPLFDGRLNAQNWCDVRLYTCRIRTFIIYARETLTCPELLHVHAPIISLIYVTNEWKKQKFPHLAKDTENKTMGPRGVASPSGSQKFHATYRGARLETTALTLALFDARSIKPVIKFTRVLTRNSFCTSFVRDPLVNWYATYTHIHIYVSIYISIYLYIYRKYRGN